MKITEIEVHTICPPYEPWHAQGLTRFQGPSHQYRTVFVFHTDNGLEGLGESTGQLTDDAQTWIDRIVGTSPWDWIAHRTLRAWLAPAIYDILGKHNGVPAYKLFGQEVRSHVPMASWTVSQTPNKMAEAVQRYAAAGYTWMKYHTNHFHNAVDQTAAMQEVAPPGFKIHYDLNWDSTVEHIVDLAKELEKFPIAGTLEDPLRVHDFEGYKVLRQKTKLPLYFHHLPIQGKEAMFNLADGYMMGHYPAGEVVLRAGLFEAMNVPFMIQNVGGHITRAFVAHMAAVFPTATKPHVNTCELWAEDVVKERFPVEGGTIRVPEEPGLGVTLDRDALERWSAAKADPLPRALARVQYRGLPPIYGRLPVSQLSDANGKGPSFVGGYGPGYNQPVDQDYLDDDGSAEFARLWDLTVSGPVRAG